jgi:hypothetical protein
VHRGDTCKINDQRCVAHFDTLVWFVGLVGFDWNNWNCGVKERRQISLGLALAVFVIILIMAIYQLSAMQSLLNAPQ